MKYKATILNISTGLFLIVILIDTIWNYSTLSSGEGWGIVSMVGLFGIGLLVGVVDLILQLFIKNSKILNIFGLLIIVALLIAFAIE